MTKSVFAELRGGAQLTEAKLSVLLDLSHCWFSIPVGSLSLIL